MKTLLTLDPERENNYHIKHKIADVVMKFDLLYERTEHGESYFYYDLYHCATLHRTDGPATTYISPIDNILEYDWMVHGNPCGSWEMYQEEAQITDSEITFLKLKYGENHFEHYNKVVR